MQYKTIDLCAGIGGIRRGFELAGYYRNVVSAEVDELACRTYENLFDENPYNDITSSDFKIELCKAKYDVLLAGFPCQAFSRVGLQKGFKDKTKGTIFFDIAEIILKTNPKVVFLENVENLVNHDKGNTFRTIIETLECELNYKVIGVTRSQDGMLVYNPRTFVRNSRCFGLPQNRPRVYIIGFSRECFGSKVDNLPNILPERGDKIIFDSVNEILESDVSERFFLSSGYLETLEKHSIRQKEKGYGFGYRIVNADGIEKPVATTLLATGGSGRERNLIIDVQNGPKYAGKNVKGKYSPINNKGVRTMTPTEWGRLQGFIDYAFLDSAGNEHFSFPEGISNLQKFKQFGNSVTIPVIETMAGFVFECLELLECGFSDIESHFLNEYDCKFRVCNRKVNSIQDSLKSDIFDHYFDLMCHFGCKNSVRNTEIADYLNCNFEKASQIISQLCRTGNMRKNQDWSYSFVPAMIDR